MKYSDAFWYGVTLLATDDVAELWTVKVNNLSGRPRKLSVYPYFPIGYKSWMNQSAEWNADVVGVVASSVTPYQKASVSTRTGLVWSKCLRIGAEVKACLLPGIAGPTRREYPYQ